MFGSSWTIYGLHCRVLAAVVCFICSLLCAKCSMLCVNSGLEAVELITVLLVSCNSLWDETLNGMTHINHIIQSFLALKCERRDLLICFKCE